jgi:hypothetical protein
MAGPTVLNAAATVSSILQRVLVGVKNVKLAEYFGERDSSRLSMLAEAIDESLEEYNKLLSLGLNDFQLNFFVKSVQYSWNTAKEYLDALHDHIDKAKKPAGTLKELLGLPEGAAARAMQEQLNNELDKLDASIKAFNALVRQPF